MASDTRPDLAVYVIECSRKQMDAMLKGLKNINRILDKVMERENKVVFGRVADKERMCIVRVSDTSYHKEKSSIGG